MPGYKYYQNAAS